MQALLKHRVVVLGGHGEFSRRVATGVAALPQAECVLGLPPGSKSMAFATRLGFPFVILDPSDSSSLQRLLEGAFAVVNTRGPFLSRDDLAIATRCAMLGVHYIDPADHPGYITAFTRLAREAREHDALLVTGAGAAPAVTGALTAMLAEHFNRVNEIHIFITPGMSDRRELATARAVFARSSEPLRLKQGGRWQNEYWWERPQTIRFPDPVGRRRGYLCDLPDLELSAKQFSARTVTARAGFESRLLNTMLSTFAAIRRRGSGEWSPAMARLMRVAAWAAGRRSSAAAIRVAVHGVRRGNEEQHVAYLIGRNGAGPAIAAAPILALLGKWIDKGVKESGAVTCGSLVDFNDLKAGLSGHDVVLVRE
jgi:saccharopine dehydrogenase-like NADP-dependent oxidoreductase